MIRDEGAYERAQELYVSAERLYKEVKHVEGMARVRNHRSVAEMELGNIVPALDLCLTSLTSRALICDLDGCAECLEQCCRIAEKLNCLETAVLLAGAADKVRQEKGCLLPSFDEVSFRQVLESIKARLGEDTFKTRWEDGLEVTLQRAVALAATLKENL